MNQLGTECADLLPVEEIHQGSVVVCSSLVVFFAPTSDIFKLPLNPRAQVKLSITNVRCQVKSAPHYETTASEDSRNSASAVNHDSESELYSMFR